MADDQQPLVYIVVLHWKNFSSTAAALKSLSRISYPNFRVIVVDNASADGSLEKLKKEFPALAFIQNKENLGFSRGCNAGIRQAQTENADYVLLLNNDMEVEPDFLAPAIRMAEQDPAVGLVTGKILFGDRRNVIWQAGGYIHRFKIQGMAPSWNQVDDGRWGHAGETGWASGAMLLIPRATLERIGLLPEEYFFGSEEWDYSTSVKKAGLKIMYVPDFKGYHYAGGSYKAGHPVLIVYNGIRNKLIYAEKHLSAPAWVAWKLLFRVYLQFVWPRRARWGCQTEEDYAARLKAARLAYADHHGVCRVELSDLTRAAKAIGPTPTWGNGWGPADSSSQPNREGAPLTTCETLEAKL
jgi:GT2 family glycosyltransferase